MQSFTMTYTCKLWLLHMYTCHTVLHLITRVCTHIKTHTCKQTCKHTHTSTYHHNHHHTGQVAKRTHVHISKYTTSASCRWWPPQVFALFDDEKTLPAQVEGDDRHKCKLCISASWWLDNYHQRKLPRVKTILAMSTSRLQQPIAACTRAQTLTRTCFCATCNLLLQPACTIVAKMVATCAGGIFKSSNSAKT